jgi:uncharacterized protein (DUF983 family)
MTTRSRYTTQSSRSPFGEATGFAPLDACPRCDGEAFDAELTTDRPVFRCACCGTGWLFELGYVRPAAS